MLLPIYRAISIVFDEKVEDEAYDRDEDGFASLDWSSRIANVLLVRTETKNC